MPEEKYGDIDVNPIETRIDTKIDSTKHSDLNSDSNFAQAIETASALISEQPESDNVVSETVVVEDVVEPTVPMLTIPEEETSIEPSVSVSAPEDSTDETTSISIPTSETPKSKKKLPLIVIGATLATLVVGGSAFAFYYNMPEKVAADAISGFIKQSNEKLAASGSLELSPQIFASISRLISIILIVALNLILVLDYVNMVIYILSSVLFLKKMVQPISISTILPRLIKKQLKLLAYNKMIPSSA